MDYRNNRILVINDDPAIHGDFEKILCPKSSSAALTTTGRSTFRLESALQGKEGVDRLIEAHKSMDPFAVAFVDMPMPPGWDGLETIEKLCEVDDKLQVVICAANPDHSWDDIQERIGETDRLLILKKPFNNVEVRQLTVSLSEKWRLANVSRTEPDRNDRRLSLTHASLLKHTRQLAVATNLAKLGYWELDLASDSFSCSACASDVFGVERGRNFDRKTFIEMFHRDDREQISSRLDLAILEQGKFACKLRVSRPNGEIRHVQIRAICESDNNNRPQTLFGAMQDVTETESALLAVQHASQHDPLTGLPNRAKFIETLDKALKRAEREGDKKALVMVDVDHFKGINDSLGHPIGDGLLVEFANRLQQLTRDTDTVARLGGDEFAIIQVGADVAQDSVDLLERTLESMKEPFDVDGKRVSATLSAGVAMSPANGVTVDDLLQAADLAMYRAKQDGRGVYRFFDESMDQRMRERRRIARDLKAALASPKEQFRLFYQPIIKTETGRVTGMETLLRWFHPTGGPMSPSRFIPIAEETGLIVEIGKWVLSKACCDASEWPADSIVAINVSAVQFRQGNLLEVVREALKASGLEPGRLQLEITETAFLNNSREIFQTLHKLRDLGVQIAVDDFGVGYSSLSFLRSFPFDYLKLDKSFVLASGTTADENDDAIIVAVARLGENLGMQTCAEGVETTEQFERIRFAGYTHAQGFLMSEPGPADKLPSDLFETSRLLPAECNSQVGGPVAQPCKAV